MATQGVCLSVITNELKKFTSSLQIWTKEPVLCKEKALAVMNLWAKNWSVYQHWIVFLFGNQWRVWELRYLGLQDFSKLGDLIIKGHFLYKLCLGMSYNLLFLEIYQILVSSFKKNSYFSCFRLKNRIGCRIRCISSLFLLSCVFAISWQSQFNNVVDCQVEVAIRCNLVLWLLWISAVNGNIRYTRKNNGSVVTLEKWQ